MEGVGSRQSRASARYAASPSAPVFNGPVRRWKKQWVTSQTNGGGGGNNNRKNPPPLLLCRWTPLSSSSTAAADEPPRRRFRYAPIVPIERGNMKTPEKDSNGGRGITTTTQTVNGSDIVSESDDITLSEKPSNGEEEEALEPNEDQADSNKAPFHGFYPRDEKRAESNEGRKMMN